MAQRYWLGSASTNVNNSANWVAVSGGSVTASIPTSADDVYIDGTNFNNCIINVSSIWNSLNILATFSRSFIINSNLTIGGVSTATVSMVGGSWTYSSGVSGTLFLSPPVNATASVSMGGILITSKLTCNQSTCTTNLLTDVVVNNPVSIQPGGGTVITFNGNKMVCKNGFAYPGNAGVINGSTKFDIQGGTFSGGNGVVLSNNVDLNAIVSPITIQNGGGNMNYRNAVMNYITGSVTHLAGNTLSVAGTLGLNTFPVIWYSVSVNNTTAITFSSLFMVSSALTIANSCTFSGPYGFSVSNLSDITAGNIIRLAGGVTYSVGDSLTLTGTNASNLQLLSSSVGTQSKFILNSGGSSSVSFVNATDIDSSNGQTIWCWSPTLVNTLNWNSLTSNQTRVYSINI